MAVIFHLNGFPGTGKLTIARALAAKTNARVIDNHTLLNPVSIVYDRSAPERKELRSDIRALVFDHLAGLPADVNLVFTDALSDGAEDRALFDEVAALARQRGDNYRAFVLTISDKENELRLTSAGRSEMHKLTDPDILSDLRRRHRLYNPAGAQHIDVTGLAAVDVADRILAAVSSQEHAP